jgi:hypothetical protein
MKEEVSPQYVEQLIKSDPVAQADGSFLAAACHLRERYSVP